MRDTPYVCAECGIACTFNRVVRMRASAVVGADERTRAKGRPIVRGSLCFCRDCHDALFQSCAMQRRYPELFGGASK